MASSIYQDFSRLRLTLPNLRVDDLKSILRQINSCLLVTARLTGRKDELVHRIESYLQEAIGTNNVENYERIRAVILRHCREPFIPPPFHRSTHITKQSGQRTPTGTTSTSGVTSAANRAIVPTIEFGSAPTPSSMIRPTSFQASSFPPTNRTNSLVNGKSSLYQTTNASPVQPSSFPPTQSPHLSSSNHHSPFASSFPNSPSAFNQRSIPINFEKSPFYRIDSAVSMVAICHKAAQNDRKSVPLSLIISPEQKAKLNQSSHYQLRMFSTSETFYNHPSLGTNMPMTTTTALIEFPTTLEIKLNNCSIASNLKGIKKKPGTTAPPDLALVPGRNGIGHALDLKTGKPNQIEIAYSNSDQRFYFVIYLVEYFGVPGLMKNLQAAPKRTEAQVIQEIISCSGDEEVMASASVVSLMDPIFFSRIKTPIRSLKCQHAQCFDAEMFYTMMEQTPTWLCPVCNIKLKNDEVLIDEYFESILKAAPSKVESVIIEADGKWHDERYEYGTSGKKKQASMSVMSIESGGSGGREDNTMNHRRFKRKVTVLELESEDDQDHGISSSKKRNKSTSGFPPDCVIDLTLDD